MNIRHSAIIVVALCSGCADRAVGPTTGNIYTLAGNGTAGYGGDGEQAVTAALYTPIDVAVGPDGRVWISDFNNYLIRVVDQGIISSVVGIGQLGDSPDSGTTSCPASDAMLNHMTNLAFHDGYVYIAAFHNSRIKRVRLADMTLENYAGIGRRAQYTGDEGPAIAAAVDLPASITFAPTGELVFLDQENQVIRRIDAAGTIHRVAGNCVVEADYNQASCATTDLPVACADSDKTTTCPGAAYACRGYCSPGFAGDGGPAMAARIAQSFGEIADPGGRMLYDRTDSLVFADTGNDRIRKVDRAGIITTIADGFHHPVGLALGDGDDLYVADTNANCVRKIDAHGVVSTVAGRCDPTAQCDAWDAEPCFAGDGGPAIEARLDRPYGIAFDGKRLYIADSYNNRVRVVYLP